MTDYPDRSALIMTAAELKQLEADLTQPDARRHAEGELRAFWRAAQGRYPDLQLPASQEPLRRRTVVV